MMPLCSLFLSEWIFLENSIISMIYHGKSIFKDSVSAGLFAGLPSLHSNTLW